MDEHDNLQTDWEDIAATANSFFTNILASSQAKDTDAVDWVMRAQVEAITTDERDSLEAPLTQQELHDAAKALAKNKVPGPDGIPVEFFLHNWELAGPVLLLALQDGIRDGFFDPELTKGFIVLLCKKGDQRYLGNKRPLTLLNVAYKIGAKAFQLRLAHILSRFITQNQYGFLPGRNIHHSLLLMNELLQEAIKSGEEHLFLKLDVVKAFDKLEWSFIFEILHKYGFGPQFVAFVKASYSSATSAVLINGRASKFFNICRSVRQGCPLSPLLFVLAIDALSRLLQQATRQRMIFTLPTTYTPMIFP